MGIDEFSEPKQTHMSALFDIPVTDEEFYMRDGGEPSEYERLIEEKRQERLLKQHRIDRAQPTSSEREPAKE